MEPGEIPTGPCLCHRTSKYVVRSQERLTNGEVVESGENERSAVRKVPSLPLDVAAGTGPARARGPTDSRLPGAGATA